MIRFPRFILLLFLGAVSQAAPLTADLGQGLVYHRAHALPTELPTAEAGLTQPCVLDLRFTTGDANAASVLAAWLKFHAQPRTPVIVIANAATSPAIRALLAHRTARAPAFVVVGTPSPEFTPDVALTVTAEADRTAYDAAEQGTALDKLVTETLDKPRNDEARIARERLPSPLENETPRTPPTDAAATANSEPPPTPALIDRVLQRAVHLHRALVALKKL